VGIGNFGFFRKLKFAVIVCVICSTIDKSSVEEIWNSGVAIRGNTVGFVGMGRYRFLRADK